MSDQQQQPAPSIPLPSDMGAFSQSSLNPQFGVWALSNEAELSGLEHYLRGEEAQPVGEEDKVVWVQKRKPTLNDQGVYEVMRFIRGITSKMVSLSNVNDAQFLVDLRHNCLEMNRFLYLNYQRFDLAVNNYSLLCTEFTNVIEYSFAKAQNKTTIDFVHPKNRGVEYSIKQSSGEQPKSGLKSFLNF